VRFWVMVRFMVRDRVGDRVRVRVMVWIVWYMDAQMAARFDGRRGGVLTTVGRLATAFQQTASRF